GLRENRDEIDLSLPAVKIGDEEDITCEAMTTTLRRAVRFLSAIQLDGGHWGAEIGGPTFFMPPL
ncbi:hypothetical protein MKW92_006706, partial [Papaver armeniacum]